MQRSGFLRIDVRLIHPYPTLRPKGRRAGDFDVVLSALPGHTPILGAAGSSRPVSFG